MADSIYLPLQEKIPLKNTLHRAADILIFIQLLSLLSYRLFYLRNHGIIWLFAFLCESWFAFVWVLFMNFKWNPCHYKTYPERLLQRFPDPPSVDMFVTTADSSLEPPIITVDTVLSLLAVDYPADKLSCYVSDDGCSPITFYSLVEASKFAKIWVPFCKKYRVTVRAPSLYFSAEPKIPFEHSSEFGEEWRKIKEEYEELSQLINEAVEGPTPQNLTGEFEVFSKVERGNHPSIVKVIWENKEKLQDGVPHLIYVAREKRPKHHHRYKAGAMNVLTRVSGVMTNAPFMLNVDCDMFANNPQIVLQAMCLLLGAKNEQESAFVQCPQFYYGGLKDDPFGNHMIVMQEYLSPGIAGIQGPMYGGTGCFHRRKIIYGLPPDYDEINLFNDKLHKEQLMKRFGNSSEFLNSAAHTISGATKEILSRGDLSSSLDTATKVADCQYEFNTCWGKEVGWVYGSATEDVLTGLRIHSMGWASIYCAPDPPAFLGCAPMGGPACLTQQKRWATGLLEIFVSSHSPLIATATKKLRFRQCLAYLLPMVWALRSIPEFCYATLPAFCLLTNTSFLPKVTEPAVLIPTTLFVIYHFYTLSEFLACRQSVGAWWNNLRMQRITSATAWLFGVLSVLLKLLGLSETLFEVTRKDQSTLDSKNNVDAGRFTFDSSPLFVPATALLLVHLTALFVGFLRVLSGGLEPALAPIEMVCSAWLVLTLLPFLKGLFRKGSYGIPWAIIYKALALAWFFFHFCGRVKNIQER
ncbi:cellulose synthase-like protein H1 isoform X1 [Tasmannia lanceolata]|uniref:cellulose synthase-like protein H1 isoform X1 n=1 Tax=Tasmannia lanceolata TaxID=3420 RepID=UPI004062D283